METCRFANQLLTKLPTVAPLPGVIRPHSGASFKVRCSGSLDGMNESAEGKSSGRPFLSNSEANRGLSSSRGKKPKRQELSPQRNYVSVSAHSSSSTILTSSDWSTTSTLVQDEEPKEYSVGKEVAELIRMQKLQSRSRSNSSMSASCSSDILEEVIVLSSEDPDTYLDKYNKLIRCGRIEPAVKILEDMATCGLLNADQVYHKRFFDECKRFGSVDLAFRFFAAMSSCKTMTVQTYSQLVATCAHFGHSEGAQRAFHMSQKAGHKPDCIIYTALISALCKANQLDMAFKTFYGMEAAGVSPSIKTFGVLIDGCAKRNQVAKAFGVYGIMLQKNLKPDAVIFNSLITACGRAGSIDRAFDVLLDMKAEELVANHVTMGALIDACIRSGRADKALDMFDAMREKGIRASREVYTAAVHACQETGDLERAKGIYAAMLEEGVRPDEIFFSALINAAAHAGEGEYAFSLLAEMRRQKMTPGGTTHSALMGLCSKMELVEEAVSLHRELKKGNLRPSLATYNALIATLCNGGQLDAALVVVEELRADGLKPDTTTYSKLIGACKMEGRADVAFRLLRFAQAEGVRVTLAICESIVDICQRQQQQGAAPPPHFSLMMPLHSAPLPAVTGAASEWVLHGLAVYRSFIACGSRPTMKLLSKVLTLLRRPVKEELVEKSDTEDTDVKDGSYVAVAEVSSRGGGGNSGSGSSSSSSSSSFSSSFLEGSLQREAEKMRGSGMRRVSSVPSVPSLAFVAAQTSAAGAGSVRSGVWGAPAGTYGSGIAGATWGKPAGLGAEGGVSGGGNQHSFLDAYNEYAYTLYEEAASLGAVPDVSRSAGPAVLKMEHFPPNLAEVCLLSLLRSLYQRRAASPGAELFPIILHLSLRPITYKVNGRKKLRELNVASRSSRSVSSLLRRLELAFAGHESSGTLRITGSSLRKWFQWHAAPPPAPTWGGEYGTSVKTSPLLASYPYGSSYDDSFRVATPGILRQQRAIRMGERRPTSVAYKTLANPTVDGSWDDVE